jgi:hypothetical protein
MPLIISLADKLRQAYPAITFVEGDDFHWSPSNKTVTYLNDSNDQAAPLLHELSHALLGHDDYKKDISLIEMERDAWQYAKDTLGPLYDQVISDDTIEDALDSYRDWLHARSTCPTCQATGIQTKKEEYKCLACHARWRVNEARICALRRYAL